MFNKDKAYEITNIELLTGLSSYSSNASSVLLEHTEHSPSFSEVLKIFTSVKLVIDLIYTENFMLL